MPSRKYPVPCTLVLLLALLASAVPAWAGPQALHVRGFAVTGMNRLLTQPVNDWGPSSIGAFGFESFGVHNPSGSLATPLTPSTPPSALLATWVDPFWLEATGIPESAIITLLNIPLREIRMIVDVTGQDRRILPEHLNATQRQASLASPSGPITLGTWLKASGHGTFNCGGSGAPGRVKLTMDGLLPYGVYTVWAVFGVGTSVVPAPLGGLSNVVVPDAKGRAVFERDLNFCPTDLKPGEAPLLIVDVVFHGDNRLYGARPNLPVIGLFEGVVSFTQLEFVVTPPAE